MSIPVNLTEMDREVAVATNPSSSGEVYIQTHAHQLSEGVAHLQKLFRRLNSDKIPPVGKLKILSQLYEYGVLDQHEIERHAAQIINHCFSGNREIVKQVKQFLKDESLDEHVGTFWTEQMLSGIRPDIAIRVLKFIEKEASYFGQNAFLDHGVKLSSVEELIKEDGDNGGFSGFSISSILNLAAKIDSLALYKIFIVLIVIATTSCVSPNIPIGQGETVTAGEATNDDSIQADIQATSEAAGTQIAEQEEAVAELIESEVGMTAMTEEMKESFAQSTGLEHSVAFSIDFNDSGLGVNRVIMMAEPIVSGGEAIGGGIYLLENGEWVKLTEEKYVLNQEIAPEEFEEARQIYVDFAQQKGIALDDITQLEAIVFDNGSEQLMRFVMVTYEKDGESQGELMIWVRVVETGEWYALNILDIQGESSPVAQISQAKILSLSRPLSSEDLATEVPDAIFEYLKAQQAQGVSLALVVGGEQIVNADSGEVLVEKREGEWQLKKAAPTLAPGEVAPLPNNQSEWNESQVYATTNEAGEEAEVIIHNGEAIELGRELVGPDGEVLRGFYEWDEITAKLGFDYKISQSGEKVKMGAYFDAIVLDASKFDDHGWLLVGMTDSEGGVHKVMLIKGNYHYFLQSLDEEGQIQALIDRGYTFRQHSSDLPGNGIEIDLTGYGTTMVTTVKIEPGDRIGLFLELEGPVNSSTFKGATEEWGYSYSFSSVTDMSVLIQDGQQVPSPRMGEQKKFVATGFIVSAENTE